MAAAPGGDAGRRPTDQPRAGTILKGRYRLTERIAGGPQADTWTAHDGILDRTVLVKLLRAGGGSPLAEHFRREVLGVVRLSHPGIVAIYDTISESDVLGLVLEQVQATPLSRFLHDGGAVSPNEAVSIALQVAEALEAAHNDGVRHLNLSPDTVWLCSDQRIKITDFGTVWRAGVQGTPVVHRSAAEEERVDVYSLGCLLRDCLTAGGTATDALPEEVADFLNTALAEDPSDRFGTAAEARSRLAAAQHPAAPAGDLLPAADFAEDRFGYLEQSGSRVRPERGPRPHRRIAVLAATAALAAGALTMTLAVGGDDPPQGPIVPTVTAGTAIEPPPVTATGNGAGPPVPTTAASEPLASAAAGVPPDASAGVAVVDVRVTTFRGGGSTAEATDALRTLDGEESTYWTTPGLRAGDATVNGVGLVFQLAEPTRLAEMTVASDTLGWSAAVHTAGESFDQLSDWGVLVDQQTNRTGRLLFDLAGQEAGAVLLWIPDPRAAVTEEIRVVEVIISAAEGAEVR